MTIEKKMPPKIAPEDVMYVFSYNGDLEQGAQEVVLMGIYSNLSDIIPSILKQLKSEAARSIFTKFVCNKTDKDFDEDFERFRNGEYSMVREFCLYIYIDDFQIHSIPINKIVAIDMSESKENIVRGSFSDLCKFLRKKDAIGVGDEHWQSSINEVKNIKRNELKLKKNDPNMKFLADLQKGTYDLDDCNCTFADCKCVYQDFFDENTEMYVTVRML